jgi:hypothetical protein
MSKSEIPDRWRKVEANESRFFQLNLRHAPLRHGLIILALGVVLLLTYANSFHAGFTLDNKYQILEDPRIRGFNEQNLRLIFSNEYWWPSFQGGLYRPVTTLTYLFNYAVLGNAQSPPGYHWINVLLHWINASLV